MLVAKLLQTTQTTYRRVSLFFKERRQKRQHATVSSHDVHRADLDKIAQKLGITELSGWYAVTTTSLCDSGATHIVNSYGGSVYRMVTALYPSASWTAWSPFKFKKAKMWHWHSIKNQRKKFNDIAKRLELKHLDDWYDVSMDEIKHYGGTGIIDRYSYNTLILFSKIYPEHDWVPFKFNPAPRGHWDTIENQREKFDYIAELLELKHLDEWCDIVIEQVAELGAGAILNKYGSLPKTLKVLYNKHEWKFKTLNPLGFWQNRENQLRFLQYAKRELQLDSMEKWYRVSQDQLADLGGSGLKTYFPRVLKVLDPNYSWEWSRFLGFNKKAAQRLLFERTTSVLPNMEVKEEHIIGHRQSTGSRMSVDVFVPAYNLCIEYQGEQHYKDVFPEGVPSTLRQLHDAEKSQYCLDHGITLVLVPYWWKGDTETLASTLKHYIPDMKTPISTSNVKPLICFDYHSKAKLKVMSPVDGASSIQSVHINRSL